MIPGPNAARRAESLVPPTDKPTSPPIGRLAALRDEAAEAAERANLLGRVPYLAGWLLVGTVLRAVLTQTASPPLLAWLTLMLAGLFALVRSCRHYMAVPFELSTLR